MATTSMSPRTPRSFNASKPPTSALPSLPNSLNSKPSLQSMRRTSLLPTSPGRSSSGAFGRPASGPSSTPRSGPSLDTPSAINSNNNSLTPKRAASIASSFPQPPRGGQRVTSLPPPSPLGLSKNQGYGLGIPSSPLSSPSRERGQRDSLMRPGPATSTRYSRDSGVGFLSGASTTSGGEYTTSPPRSRSSSAQDSYSTNATTMDPFTGVNDEDSRGRPENRNGGGFDDGGGDDDDDKDSKGHVTISIRVRPDGPEEQMDRDWVVDNRSGKVGYKGKDGGVYEFDNVFSQNDNNANVYDYSAKRLVRRVMEGFHGTVFAYGMTGTGKTFSMQGNTSSPGVIPLAINDIFAFIRETPHREFLLRVSYLEIYNERIHDLLASEPGAKGFVPLDQQSKGEEIKLREDPKRGVYATPLQEEIVQSPTQLLRVIARGDLCRRTGSTQFNARSSRSHAVVQIVVESRDRIAGAAAGNMADNRRAGMNGGVRVSTLSLIDLAGSERAAENKERRTEGSHINKSLLTLGTVIARLAKDKGDGKEKADNSHLPYRDSKLTRLLQPALSGNSLISILCTIAIPLNSAAGSANITNIGETMNTLKFAARARNNIVSHAKKGEDVSGGLDAASKVLMEKYKQEIKDLRRELEQQRKKDQNRELEQLMIEERAVEREVEERHGEQLVEMQLARSALKERIEHLNRLIITSKTNGINSARSSVALPTQEQLAIALNSIPPNMSAVRLSSSSSSSSSDAGEDSATTSCSAKDELAARVSALTADLSDRNRYIETLERRLLHARKSSQSRASYGISRASHGVDIVPEASVDVLLKEKDQEIAELRARLDDKERMVSALRSAARKRELAELCVANRRASQATSEESSGERRSRGRASLADKVAAAVAAAAAEDECF